MDLDDFGDLGFGGDSDGISWGTSFLIVGVLVLTAAVIWGWSG